MKFNREISLSEMREPIQWINVSGTMYRGFTVFTHGERQMIMDEMVKVYESIIYLLSNDAVSN